MPVSPCIYGIFTWFWTVGCCLCGVSLLGYFVDLSMSYDVDCLKLFGLLVMVGFWIEMCYFALWVEFVLDTLLKSGIRFITFAILG